MSVQDEVLTLRMQLKGQREAVAGFKEVNAAQKGLTTSTTAVGVASAKAEKHTSHLGRAYASLGKAARYGLGFLGVGGLFAIESAIKNTEELSKTTVGLTRNFDFQNNVASRWAAVAQSRDIDSKALGMSFGTLSTKLTNAAREGGKALLPFHQLGLTQEDAAKGAHNFEWGILRVAKALGEEEGGAKRAAAAKALLGKGFQTLLPLFSEGTKGLKEQLHWADEYGVTLSGKTTDAVMEMVQAQRENKVAMLGLQISLTKALMPAIHMGDEQLQQFIRTLNDPNMSGDEKLVAVQHQFEHIENVLTKVIVKALPSVAEHSGQLGVKMAGAVLHGFERSNLLGKIVIAGWIFRMFGGEALVKKGAMKVGGQIGTDVGLGMAAGVVGGYIAYEVWEHLGPKAQQEVVRWGWNAGANFANFFIKALNKTLDDANVFAILGVDAPEVGEVGGPPSGKPDFPGVNKHYKGLPPKHYSAGEQRKGYEKLWGQAPPPGPPPWPPPHRKAATQSLTQPRIDFSQFGASRPIVIHTHHKTELDGKVLAENTAHHVASAEALG